MAKIRMVYFAWVRERIGTGEEMVEPPASVATVADLVDWLAETSAGHAEAFENRSRLRHTDRIRERLASLSPREREVLELVTQGKANKMVAGDLGVSQRTVEIHRAHVMQKMEADSLAELVRLCLSVKGEGVAQPA